MKKITTSLLMVFMAMTIAFGQDSIDCSGITKRVDEFTGEIIFQAKITDGVDFYKFKNGRMDRYYLDIWIKTLDIYTGTGVIIILKNGRKINKPKEEVEYKYMGGSFYSRAFIALTADDIALLKQSGIVKYKLYISTGEISDYSDLSKDLFNCLYLFNEIAGDNNSVIYKFDGLNYYFIQKKITTKDKFKVADNENQIFSKVDIEAGFPGGEEAWRNYLRKTLNASTPVDYGASGGEYTVIVKFVVSKDGSLSDVKCENDPGFGMCDEAIRVIKRTKNWIPAIQNGRSVNAYRRQPITFLVED